MRNTVIAPIGTYTDTLRISSIKVCFLLGEQLVITFGFGNRFFKPFGGDGLYQIVDGIYLIAL